MTSQFHEIQGINKYCGPAVLAAITGKSTDHCAAVISAVSGKSVIKGVQYQYIIDSLKRLNFEVKTIPTPARTLFGCISALINMDGMYIIAIPDHYVAVEIKEKIAFFIDNHTKSPIPAGASARLTQNVQLIWKATPIPTDVIKRKEVEDRKAWLLSQIKQVEYNISRLVDQKLEYKRELEKLSEKD